MKTYRVDANVILRFLTGQPGERAQKARRLMNRADRGEIRLRVSLLIIAEIYWVLNSYYEFSRERIRDVLSRFIRARGVEVRDPSLIERSLTLSAERNVDFVDAVLALRGKETGEPVVTFDESDFQSLPAGWKTPEEAVSDV